MTENEIAASLGRTDPISCLNLRLSLDALLRADAIRFGKGTGRYYSLVGPEHREGGLTAGVDYEITDGEEITVKPKIRLRDRGEAPAAPRDK